MKIRYSMPVLLDTYTPGNVLQAGLDDIRRSRGRDTPLVQPTRLFPWFWNTARNGVLSPEESTFVLTNEECFVKGLRDGHAVIQPDITDGLVSIVERDAELWPDGPIAMHEARKSLRNFWWLGVADPFIRSYAMSKLGPLAGPAALKAFEKAKRHLRKKARTVGVRRLRRMVPQRKEKNGKKR